MTLRNIDALFNARRIVVLGAVDSPAQQQLLDNIEASVASDRRSHITARAARARLPATDIELGVVLDAGWGRPRIVSALAERGCHAIFWAASAAIPVEVLRAARPSNLRILGAWSAGIVDTRVGLNISTLPRKPRPGSVAAITQSRSLGAAALDWALGRNIGFSWLACTGSESDIDVADLLDYAALDPETRAVVLQIGRIRAPRKFMSAARAAARVKPVLVLQTRHAVFGGPAGPDPARSAAFARAGLVECENLGALFDGLAALELLPTASEKNILVVGNGAGVCDLGTDALVRRGLTPARVAVSTRRQLAENAPAVRDTGMALDLGQADHDATIAALRIATAQNDTDCVLFIHGPVAGQASESLARALIEAGLTARLMTVWLGLYTARAAREVSAGARLATFASADQAVDAILYRSRHRYTRELLTATPPPDPSVTADAQALTERLSRIAERASEWLSSQEAVVLLTAYGFAGDDTDDAGIRLRVRAALHPEVGMVLSVQDEARTAAPVRGLPPLDALLARRMLDAAGINQRRTNDNRLAAFGRALVRLARLVTDLAPITGLDVRVTVSGRGRLQAAPDSLVELTREPAQERQRLALTPYPVRMRHRVTLLGGKTYTVRAIQPSDEPAVLDLLESLDAEEIRLRFFTYIRHFSHDMAARLTQVDYDREVALVASSRDSPATLAGMATLIADPDKREAEFALLVHHDHTGSGLGRHLLDCLLRQAHAHGIQTVYGHVLAHNTAMRRLAEKLGFTDRWSTADAGNVRVDIPVAEYMNNEE